jgi:hypothetical protein
MPLAHQPHPINAYKATSTPVQDFLPLLFRVSTLYPVLGL